MVTTYQNLSKQRGSSLSTFKVSLGARYLNEIIWPRSCGEVDVLMWKGFGR